MFVEFFQQRNQRTAPKRRATCLETSRLTIHCRRSKKSRVDVAYNHRSICSRTPSPGTNNHARRSVAIRFNFPVGSIDAQRQTTSAAVVEKPRNASPRMLCFCLGLFVVWSVCVSVFICDLDLLKTVLTLLEKIVTFWDDERRWYHGMHPNYTMYECLDVAY